MTDEADLMCPNCLTPWKCNGPHLDNLTPLSIRQRKRRNRNNRARGSKFETTVAKALGARRTGPLGGRDDVIGDTVAVQTKKTINFSMRQARTYLDDLSRTYPTRTALVIHAEPGRDREAVVVLRLSDWLLLHGPDGIKEPAA